MKSYWVYVMANAGKTVLYVGVTNNLERRVYEHKALSLDGFTKKYKCTELVYFEETSDVTAAIAREKQLKRWSRAKKDWLIDSMNPARQDLSTSLEMTESDASLSGGDGPLTGDDGSLPGSDDSLTECDGSLSFRLKRSEMEKSQK